MRSEKTGRRRRCSRDSKEQVTAEGDMPGAPVAKVAMSDGINTNVVQGWRKSAHEAGAIAVRQQQEFVPLQLEPPTSQSAPDRDIEVELRRGAVSMKITWPSSATADFAAWTCELLR